MISNTSIDILTAFFIIWSGVKSNRSVATFCERPPSPDTKLKWTDSSLGCATQAQ